MTYLGKVQREVVVIDGQERPADGTIVSVSVIKSPQAPEPNGRTWAEVFKDVIGKAKALPADSSENHDHHLYGVPKRR